MSYELHLNASNSQPQHQSHQNSSAFRTVPAYWALEASQLYLDVPQHILTMLLVGNWWGRTFYRLPTALNSCQFRFKVSRLFSVLSKNPSLEVRPQVNFSINDQTN